LWGILSGVGLILVVGLIDDIWKLNWQFQLFFQICVAVIVFVSGVQIEYITNPFGGLIHLAWGASLLPGFFIGVFWIVLLMNAINWLDGIDGLSGGVSLISALAIFILAIKPEVNQPPVGIISIALIGAILGFLIFNFYPAKIMAGTSGSFFLGFMLASLSIFAGTKIATTLLVLTIPIVDAIAVMVQRFYFGKSIFKADSSHLHHKLLHRGWSQKKISWFFYSITFLLFYLAVSINIFDKMMIILLTTIVVLIAVVAIENNKIKAN